MKRWMVRLAMLSVMMLIGLLLYAHANRNRDQQVASQGQETAIPPVKPIPLAEEEPGEPTAAAGNPFAARSRLVDATAASATESEDVAATGPRYASANDQAATDVAAPRYATVGDRYANSIDATKDDQAEPLAETDELPAEEEPRPLMVPADASALQPQRNPFKGTVASEEAAAPEAIEVTSEAAAPAFDEVDETAVEPAAHEQDRYGAQTSYGGNAPLRPVPAATPAFDEAEALPAAAAGAAAADNLSAFAPMQRESRDVVDDGYGAGEVPVAAGTGKPGDARLEGEQSPRLVIEKMAPEEIQVGKPAKFTVVVRNEGEVTAFGVEIHDEVPQGTELNSTQPKAQETAGKLRWQLGDLKPGAETSVEMEVTPQVEGEVGSVASVTFRAGASAKAKVTRPRLQLEVAAPEEVLIGDQVDLKITVSNPGTGVANGVVITEQIPAGLTHPAGKELEFEVGTLAPGESRSLELTLLAAKPGDTVNVLLAQGQDNLQAEQQTTLRVVAPALEVGLNGPKRRYLQRSAKYEISVHNPGTAPANDVELEAVLPAGMEFIECNNQGQYDPSAHRVVWSLEALPPGETGTVTLTTLAVQSGEQPLRVSGKAQMNLSDQTEEMIRVEGVAAILFELVDVHDPVEINGQTTYEIRVINQGSAAATGVRVAALLPRELEVTSAEGPVNHKVEPGRVLFEPLTQLAPKADTTYLVHVKTLAAGDQRIKVQVITDQVTTPITKEESTHVYGDE